MGDLLTSAERTNSILNGTAGTIVFNSSEIYAGHQSYAHPWYSLDVVGDGRVYVNQESISRSAAKYGVDPTLLTAIIYMENSHGYYDILKPGGGSSYRPGNVQGQWAALLGLKPQDLKANPHLNIAVTAKLLAEIQARLDNPSPEAIASLFNSMARDKVSGYGLTILEYMEERPWLHCFPAHTPIQTSLTATTPIADVRVGDVVFAFDPHTDNGRGALVPRRVSKLFRNVTEAWVRLAWVNPVTGEARELVATPGHHFLDQFGNFPPIEQMIRDGGATVVLASGELVEVSATRIVYSAVTAHLFEQAQSHIAVSGNTALKPQMREGWQTYNFEVEDLHTYVAGGVRVHNVSLFAPETGIGQLGDNIGGQISDFAFGANTLTGALAGSAVRSLMSTAFEAKHKPGTRAQLALSLLLYTGQRRSDVVRMGWQHITGDLLSVVQDKTGEVLKIPFHPKLAAAIGNRPRTNMTFLLTELGAPFTAAGFGNWFRDRCNEAGLPHCSAHGLRKACAARLANAGCTSEQIKAITGHKTLSEVARYTKAADQDRNAKQALANLVRSESEQYRPTCDPGLDKSREK